MGEASPDVHKLIATLAYTGTEAHGLACGGTTTKATTGTMAWIVKRQLARVVLKNRAKMLLDRRFYIGPGAPMAGDGAVTHSEGLEPARGHSPCRHSTTRCIKRRMHGAVPTRAQRILKDY